MFRGSVNKRKLRRTIGALAVEVIVVGVGLYGALLLDAYTKSRSEQTQRKQILSSIKQYLQIAATELHEDARETERTLVRPFLDAYERGEMPRPEPVLMGASGLSSNVWEAMLASGGTEVLDPRLITDMELYYSVVRHCVTRIDRFAEMTRRRIVPQLDSEISEFYDTETRRLHRRYEWYPLMLSDYGGQVKRLSKETRDAVNRLEKQLASMR